MNQITYLNTDLDLVSADDLATLAAAFKRKGAFPLHVTRSGDLLWRATFETKKSYSEPGAAIDKILAIVESMPKPLRSDWADCILREFNLGYMCGDEPWAFNHGLSHELLGRMASLRASLRFTLYPLRERNE